MERLRDERSSDTPAPRDGCAGFCTSSWPFAKLPTTVVRQRSPQRWRTASAFALPSLHVDIRSTPSSENPATTNQWLASRFAAPQLSHM